jgi:hypothetical protein
MVRFGLEQAISLPVNYCSFPYKRRFQHAAARRRAALAVSAPGTIVTECGYLRIISAAGLQYSESVLLQNPSYRFPFEKIVLETGRSLYVERRLISQVMELSEAEIIDLEAGVSPERLARFEKIEIGLAEYF